MFNTIRFSSAFQIFSIFYEHILWDDSIKLKFRDAFVPFFFMVAVSNYMWYYPICVSGQKSGENGKAT